MPILEVTGGLAQRREAILKGLTNLHVAVEGLQTAVWQDDIRSGCGLLVTSGEA